MDISSVCGKGRNGRLGRGAEDFADFLAASGQRVWQILPMGPRAKGNSPYSLHSSFAGNPDYIDCEKLCDIGVLNRRELISCAGDAEAVELAARAVKDSDIDYRSFLEAEGFWLEDFALYMAIRKESGKIWSRWPENIRRRDRKALSEYSERLKKESGLIKKTQYLFRLEWSLLRDHLKKRNVELMGDLPIYPSFDSAEVWANPGAFILDEKLCPRLEAGVPPDDFSDSGQLWENPVYDWEALREENYDFWLRRFCANLSLFDILRLDHFRGIESYWAAPAGSKRACDGGAWYKGPGRELVEKIKERSEGKQIVAEALGVKSRGVEELLEFSGFPSIKVLQFGLLDGPDSGHFPDNVGRNTVLYTGTHDNDTLVGFLESAGEERRNDFASFLRCSPCELYERVISAGCGSESELFIVPMQDYLKLGSEARMNIPGVSVGNWRWRIKDCDLSAEKAESIKKLIKEHGR